MVSIVGSQTKETSYRLLLKGVMFPLSMGKAIDLSLTNERTRLN